MGLRTIINFGEAINVAIGVNIILLSDGAKDISYTVVERKKDMLSVVEGKNGIKEIDQLSIHLQPLLSKGTRVHVNILGKSILTKPSAHIKGDLDSEFNKLYPGLKKQDFVLQQFKSEAALFISVIRKEDVMREDFITKNAHSITLGIPIIESISPMMAVESVTAHHLHITLNNSKIIAIESTVDENDKNHFIAGMNIPTEQLLAFASAVSLFISVPQIKISGLNEDISTRAQYYLARKEIYLIGRIVLFVVLAMMIVNTLCFMWLNQAVTEARSYLSLFEGKSKKNEIEHKVNSRMSEAFDEIGWRMNRVPIFYADQIAQTVPDLIQLTTLETGILKENIYRKEKKLAFNSSAIKISGISSDPLALSDWISNLKKLPWIKMIRQQRYQFDPQKKKGVFEFSVETD